MIVGQKIQNIFERNEMLLVIHFGDLNTATWDTVRGRLQEKEAFVKVLPTKITQRVLEETAFSNLRTLLRGPSALVYGKSNGFTEVLHVIKSQPKFALLGGIVEREMFTPLGLEKLASLPSRFDLQCQLLSTVNAVSSRLVSYLNYNQQRTTGLLENLIYSDY